MDNREKKQTLSSMLWVSFQKFGVMGISFISNIILARLLTPEDYGCLGMLMIFILLANTFIDSGFGDALIQKKEPTQEDYSTIFYWNFIIGLFFYFLIYLSAPLIADFYNIELLAKVLRVQAVIIVIQSLNLIQRTKLRKQFEFKRITLINMFAVIISVSTAIVLAYKGFGVWSLVSQQIICEIIICICYWTLNKWKPSFIFSLKSFRELFSFGTFLLFSNLFNTFCNNIESVLLGKFFTPGILGYYTQSKKIESIASTSISEIVNQVSYPVFSKYQEDKDNLIKILRQFIKGISFITMPMMFCLILIAKPLILILYSEKWIDCVPYFQILCIAGIAISLQGINYDAVAAIGKSGKIFKYTIVKRIIGIIFLIMGYKIYGLWGFLIGSACASYLYYFVNAYMVSKFVGYKLFIQIKDLLPIITISIVAFLLIYCISPMLYDNLYVQAFLQILFFIITYIALSFILKNDSLELYKRIISSLRAKF